jgi:amidase
VLVKDNLATGDKMATTGGSLALKGVRATRDAFVVEKLRAAGAVILGKTNLSEWANIRSTRSTSGWSAVGGLTRNPYALDRNTSGSSSGTGAAIAASLAAAGIGTETDGSIISPSTANGLVGMKPTVGLVSRAGIIPISVTQDTAGPMARSVADAAILLAAIAGTDTADDTTRDASVRAADYAKALDRNALKGARIGVVRSQFGGRNDLASAQVEKALEAMREQGAVLVDIAQLPNAGRLRGERARGVHVRAEGRHPEVPAEYAPNAPVKTLADVIAFNEREAKRELKYFGQEYFIQSEAKGGLESPEYLAAIANNRKLSREEGIDKALRENNLDALVAPSAVPRGSPTSSGAISAAAVFRKPPRWPAIRTSPSPPASCRDCRAASRSWARPGARRS